MSVQYRDDMDASQDPVASAQEVLNALPAQPLEDHVEAFESVHRALTEALSAIDNL